MALLQVLCIIYTWLTSEDRTLIVAVLVTCMFNFLLLKDTVIALIKPVRILVSKEYQIEYMFIVFTLVLMASVLTGLSVEPLMKMLTA
jgi:Ca2+/Na+ antiporter